jgi:hypothetical protein
MGYIEALNAAGGDVVESEFFGSYQGEWVARLADGRVIVASFGSCGWCDSFNVEFGYDDPDEQKLADFGREYLEGAYTVGSAEWDRLLADYRERAPWGYDDAAVLSYLERFVE